MQNPDRNPHAEGTGNEVEHAGGQVARRLPPWLGTLAKHGLGPAAFYLAWFGILTFPLLLRFRTHFFTDRADGLMNVWSVWWVDLATRRPDLYASIWQTSLLHWPWGTTLIGHTLNPFNGYLAVGLLQFLSLTQSYNSILIFSFVMGGVTTYWLAYWLTGSYWGSLVAGFIFTFSSYHFAHARGHLNLVALEWLPLFLLLFSLLITEPRPVTGVAAGFALWLVGLCDYYYLFYCMLACLLFLIWRLWGERSWRFLTRMDYAISFTAFLVTAYVFLFPIAGRLLLTNYRDPLIGSHEAEVFSLDLPSLIVPGEQWALGRWTETYWSRLAGNPWENNVYLALPVFFLIGYLWINRHRLAPATRSRMHLWLAMVLMFVLFALGPAVQIGGQTIWTGITPYRLLRAALPFLSIAGVPVRMSVMVILGASVLSAMALKLLWQQSRHRVPVTSMLFVVLLFQTWPSPLPTLRPIIPEYVQVLAKLPEDGGGVLDLVTDQLGLPLYYQTIHGKPIAFGYLARVPTSVAKQDQHLSEAIAAHDYAGLWDTYHIRYLVTRDVIQPDQVPQFITLHIEYEGHGTRIYRLGCVCEASP